MKKVTFGGKELKLVFTTGAMEAMEENYGGIQEAMDKISQGKIADIVTMITILANAAAEIYGTEKITRKFVSNFLPPKKLTQITETIVEVISDGMTADEIDTEENSDAVLEEIEKNALSR